MEERTRLRADLHRRRGGFVMRHRARIGHALRDLVKTRRKHALESRHYFPSRHLHIPPQQHRALTLRPDRDRRVLCARLLSHLDGFEIFTRQNRQCVPRLEHRDAFADGRKRCCGGVASSGITATRGDEVFGSVSAERESGEDERGEQGFHGLGAGFALAVKARR